MDLTVEKLEQFCLENFLNDYPRIWFNIPEPIDSFCGREDFLRQLHDQLKPRDDAETEVTVLSQVKIVSGLGGIGKTETARRYIMKQRKFYNNFIWINAETEISMRNSFFKLAEEIKIPIKNSEGNPREIPEIVKEIYNKISEGGKSNLMVFDNAEDYQSCCEFFPFGIHPDLTKPVILATSRNQDWISTHGKIQVLPLDKMTENESREFIFKQLEIPSLEIANFRQESKELIKLIGGLPLALQQAVAFIKEEKELRKLRGKLYKISDYALEFKLSMEKFLSFSPVPESALDSSATIFTTWKLTFKKIQKLVNGESAVKILEILCFLYADKIPLSFLHNLLPEREDVHFSVALLLLKKYALIKMDSRDSWLSIHRQLQFVILQYLKDRDDVSNVVMKITEKCEVVLQNLKMAKSSDIFLNIHQIVKNSFDLIPINEKFLDFVDKFAGVLSKATRYSESLDFYKKVYSKSQEVFGESHEKTLGAQHEIALQFSKLGKYDEALILFKENLEKKEIHPDFGVDHPDTMATKNKMAVILQKLEKYQESLELFQQVFDHQNKTLGENGVHPEIVSTQNVIGLLHSKLGNFPQALTLYEDVERKQIEILGPHHPHVFTTKHNKATVLYKMKEFQEASKIFQEVHEKDKETFGESHLETTNSLFWIARILEHEGKLKEALEQYKKVYEIRKKNLGEGHPDAAQVKSKIVGVEINICFKSHQRKS